MELWDDFLKSSFFKEHFHGYHEPFPSRIYLFYVAEFRQELFHIEKHNLIQYQNRVLRHKSQKVKECHFCVMGVKATRPEDHKLILGEYPDNNWYQTFKNPYCFF